MNSGITIERIQHSVKEYIEWCKQNDYNQEIWTVNLRFRI